MALVAMPDGVGVDIRNLGAYDACRIGGDSALTDRQAEAVAAAVDRVVLDTNDPN